MDLMQGILTRRSVRSYRAQEKISKQELTDLLKAAMQAPSAMNKQPWSFVVVDKPDIPCYTRIMEGGERNGAYDECGNP